MRNRFFDLLLKIMKLCSLNEEKIRTEFDLSTAEYNGLLVLEPFDHVLCNEFSKKMGLSPSRGSRIIDRLMRKKYVASEQMKNDRRMVQITLTPMGIRARRKIMDRMDECEQRFLQRLSVSQQTDLKNNLETLITAIAIEDGHDR